MFKGPMAAAQQRRGSNDDWTDDRTGSRTSSGDPADPAKSSKSRLELAGRHHRNTIAVGDVDGRAFDILLRSVKIKIDFNNRITDMIIHNFLNELMTKCPNINKAGLICTISCAAIPCCFS